MKLILSELEFLPADSLHLRAREARSRLAQTDWELAAILLAIERNGLYQQRGCSSIVQYGTRYLALDPHKTGELVRTARVLENLPLLSEAFRQGQLGWGKMRELTRVVCPETEQRWLDFALTHTTDQIEREVALSPREWKRRAQAAGSSRQATQGAMFAPLTDSEQGSTAEPGARGPAAAAGPAEGGPPGGSPPDDPRPAETAQAANPSGPVPVPLPGPKLVKVVLHFTPDEYALYERSVAHIRARLAKRVRREQATVEMARQSLAGAPARTRARHQVVVHVDAASETACYETDRGALAVAAEELEQALSTGAITLQNRTEDKHSSGRKSEETLEPAAARKPSEQSSGRKKSGRPPVPLRTLTALFLRAGGRCETPDCQARGPLHVHHRLPWSRGGTHALSNLELRCGSCHSLEHQEDFQADPQWRRARSRRRGQASG